MVSLLASCVNHLLTFTRANTTCKVAAFGAPRWALSQSFWEGDMALSERVVKLCEAYERQGRADLAHCVRNARVHQLLDPFLGTDFYNQNECLHHFLSNRHAMIMTLDPSSSSKESSLDGEAMKSTLHPSSILELNTLIHQWEIETEKKVRGR
jgi:hypothetical protein